MALRIVIQKEIRGQWVDTDLAYTFDKVFEILRARLHEDLSLKEKEVKNIFGTVKGIKREWTMEEIEDSLNVAAKFFMEEFKLKTVSLA